MRREDFFHSPFLFPCLFILFCKPSFKNYALIPFWNHRRPVMLGIQIRKAVGSLGAALKRHIADDQRIFRNRQRIAQQIAVLIYAAVAVIIAQKFQRVAALKASHALCDGLCLSPCVYGLDTGHKAMRLIVSKHQDQFCPAAIVKHWYPAGDRVIGSVVHSRSVIIGYRLSVDGQSGGFV